MAARSSTSLFPRVATAIRDCITGVNPDRLRERVEEAQTALFSRLQVLSRRSGHETEIQAIENALGALQVLTQETVKPPLENE